MKMDAYGDTLRVLDVNELGADSANEFRDLVRSAFGPGMTNIEVDLKKANFIDSCGLGALIALQKTARGRGGIVRLLDPQPPVQQILKLTRMHQFFEISQA
jgi:anti-anti-sigma factor